MIQVLGKWVVGKVCPLLVSVFLCVGFILRQAHPSSPLLFYMPSNPQRKKGASPGGPDETRIGLRVPCSALEPMRGIATLGTTAARADAGSAEGNQNSPRKGQGRSSQRWQPTSPTRERLPALVLAGAGHPLRGQARASPRGAHPIPNSSSTGIPLVFTSSESAGSLAGTPFGDCICERHPGLAPQVLASEQVSGVPRCRGEGTGREPGFPLPPFLLSAWYCRPCASCRGPLSVSGPPLSSTFT